MIAEPTCALANATSGDGSLSPATLDGPTTDATDASTDGSAACAGGLPFSADTLVQMPSYDLTTWQATTQTITHVYLNHDSDRLDVMLALPRAAPRRRSRPPPPAHSARW